MLGELISCWGTVLRRVRAPDPWRDGRYIRVRRAGGRQIAVELVYVAPSDIEILSDIIAGNIAQLGGHIDRVITAQQAGPVNRQSRSSILRRMRLVLAARTSSISGLVRISISPPPVI